MNAKSLADLDQKFLEELYRIDFSTVGKNLHANFVRVRQAVIEGGIYSRPSLCSIVYRDEPIPSDVVAAVDKIEPLLLSVKKAVANGRSTANDLVKQATAQTYKPSIIRPILGRPGSSVGWGEPYQASLWVFQILTSCVTGWFIGQYGASTAMQVYRDPTHPWLLALTTTVFLVGLNVALARFTSWYLKTHRWTHRESLRIVQTIGLTFEAWCDVVDVQLEDWLLNLRDIRTLANSHGNLSKDPRMPSWTGQQAEFVRNITDNLMVPEEQWDAQKLASAFAFTVYCPNLITALPSHVLKG